MLIAVVISLAGFRFQIAHLILDVCRHIIVVPINWTLVGFFFFSIFKWVVS